MTLPAKIADAMFSAAAAAALLLLAIVFVALLALAACGVVQAFDDAPGACRTVNYALVDRKAVCGLIGPDSIQQFRDQIAVDCEEAASVRDYDGMMTVCVPWVLSLHCDDLPFVAALVPPECLEQFRR